MATGDWLLFQVKGTRRAISPRRGLIPVNVPVKLLAYAERFIVPFLYVVCATYTRTLCASTMCGFRNTFKLSWRKQSPGAATRARYECSFPLVTQCRVLKGILNSSQGFRGVYMGGDSLPIAA